MTINGRVFLVSWCAFVIFLTACSSDEYTKDSTIIGIVEELKVQKKFLQDDKFLVVHSEEKGRNKMEIPVDTFEAYEVGQKVKVTIFSNTDDDVWDLNHLKFEIDIVGD